MVSRSTGAAGLQWRMLRLNEALPRKGAAVPQWIMCAQRAGAADARWRLSQLLLCSGLAVYHNQAM